MEGHERHGQGEPAAVGTPGRVLWSRRRQAVGRACKSCARSGTCLVHREIRMIAMIGHLTAASVKGL